MNHAHQKPVILEVGAANFESEVLKSSQPVLAAFGATWSQPCRIFLDVIEQLALTGGARFKVVIINADDNPDLSMWYEIQSIPTLICFVGGTVRAKLVGTATKEAILAKLEPLCGPFTPGNEPPGASKNV